MLGPFLGFIGVEREVWGHLLVIKAKISVANVCSHVVYFFVAALLQRLELVTPTALIHKQKYVQPAVTVLPCARP